MSPAICPYPQAFTRLEESQLQQAQNRKNKGVHGHGSTLSDDQITPAGMRSAKDRGFDAMNAVAGRVVSQLTCSSRFHGDLNVDLNEICTNLVPFPRLPFLTAALSPRRISSTGKKQPCLQSYE